jgi:hypothetical protein
MSGRIDEIVFRVECFVDDYGEGVLLVLGMIGALLVLIYWLS